MNRKSLSKRVRVTKNGKVMRRSAGVSHNRSNKTSAKLNSKKRAQPISNKVMVYLK
ncbi:MAG: 50S ribosomal protein L35 [Patescibacteria group bacterium]